MKKKRIIEIIILVVLLFLLVFAILDSVLGNSLKEGGPSTTIDNQDYSQSINEQDVSEVVENMQTSQEILGDMLSTGKAIAHSFCNGYGVVRYNDTTYIINTAGEILSSFHRSAEWGDIIYAAEDWNFYDGTAVFISEHGTVSFPIEYDGENYYYWYKTSESEVVTVTKKNEIIIRETVQRPEGTTTKLGVQDYLGDWIIESKEIGVQIDSDDKISYRGNNEFLITIQSAGEYYTRIIGYYSFNVESGVLENLGKNAPEKKVYYKDDFVYKDQIEYVSSISEGIQVLTIKNPSGALFAVAIDENGNQLYEPIQILSYYGSKAGSYSEGLLGLEISENNTEYIIYVDENGMECARIPGRNSYFRCAGCHSGIISNDHHYYDKTGKLLFE